MSNNRSRLLVRSGFLILGMVLTIATLRDVYCEPLHRIGNVRIQASNPRGTTGDIDGDGKDEVTLVCIDGRGQIALLVYEPSGDTKMKRIGDTRIQASNPQDVMGDVDGDGRDEITVACIDGRGRIALLVYEPSSGIKLNRIGDERIQASNPQIAMGDVDGDGKDEITLGCVDGGGRIALLVYEPSSGVKLKRIGDERIGASNPQVAMGDIDGDGRDEITVACVDKRDRIALLVYESFTGVKLKRIGDERIGASNPLVTMGDFDGDGRDEITMACVDRGGRIALLVYEPFSGTKMKRIGDERIEAANPLVKMGDVDGDRRDEITVACVDKRDRIALLVYEPFNGVKMKRIGDERIQASNPHIAMGDVDGDEKYDIVLSCIDGSNRTALLVYNYGYSVADFEETFYNLKIQGTDTRPKHVPLVVVAWEPRGLGLHPRISAGNLNGTDRAEIIVSVDSYWDGYISFIYESGSDGNLSRIAGDTMRTDSGVQNFVGDFNGDGTGEVALITEIVGKDEQNVALLIHELTSDNQLKRTKDNRPVGKAPTFSTGDLDGDGADEVALTLIDDRGQVTLLVYEYSHGTKMKIIGDEHIQASNPQVAMGDIDGDGMDEVIVACIDGGGHTALLAYELSSGNKMKRIGDTRIQPSNPQVAMGDVDGDGRDEIAVACIDKGGNIALLVFEPSSGTKMKRIGDTRIQASLPQVVMGDVDGDKRDEIVLTCIDKGGRIALLVYEPSGSTAMKRVGNERMEASNPHVTMGDVDGDSRDEIILACVDGRGRIALLVYEPSNGTKLKRIGDERFDGSAHLSIAGLQQLFFGATESVTHWFHESSLGRYRLTSIPGHSVIGPAVSEHDWKLYWRVGPYAIPLPGEPHHYVDNKGNHRYMDDDGFYGGHSHSWAEAVLFADNIIDFSVYDTNRDRKLSPDECIIAIVKLQLKSNGNIRPVVRSHKPDQAMFVDNCFVKEISEVYAAPPYGSDDLAIAIEEVLHRAANLADQYVDNDHRLVNDPRLPGQLSLTDANRKPVHTDPYHKLKWGWLNPKLVLSSGRYKIKQVAKTGDALILFNPGIGTDEFFILENRWRGNSYDRYRTNDLGEGLVLWHCVQDTNLKQDWARRALHLRRADPTLDATGEIQNNLTLFDGGDPVRSYVLDDDSSPQNLRFRNNKPSGIRIENISKASEEMTVDIKLDNTVH